VSAWTKLEPLTVRTGCLCCPPKPDVAPLDWDPDPGFGYVALTRGGEAVVPMYMRHWDEEDGDATCMTIQDFEDRAAGDPDHDWRFEVHGPLGGVVYQRQGEGTWVSVKRLEGFA
jgi:hypothetical protein